MVAGMPEKTATQRLLDHLIPAGLEAYVAQKRRAGVSWRRVSLDLRDDFEVDVTPQTLHSWYRDLPVAKRRGAA